MQKVVTELKKRIENSKNEEKILVIYHFDVDGCASASILWRMFNNMGLVCEFCPATRGFEQMAIKKIKEANPSKVILVDYIPSRAFANFLIRYKTEVLDHHTHEDFLEKFDYFTSADHEIESSISYLLSLTAEEMGIKDTKWLGFVGAFWDKCLESTEFFEKGIYKKEIEKMLPFNLVVSLTQISGSKKTLEVFNTTSKLEDALERIKSLEEYMRAKKIFDEELKEIKFSRKYFSDIKLNIFWVRTKFKHIRIFVDYITYSTKGTHIFVLDEKTRFKLSFRTSFEINLVDIIRNLAEKNKEFGGGGHPKACGAMLKNENIEELISDFIDEYREVIKKVK